MKYIMEFKDIQKEDILAVGGKGANLGELFNSGFPVPNGFCITSYAFDEYIKRNNLKQQLSTSSNPCYDKITNGQFWSELEQEILECYTSLGQDARVAVRSSATAEDLPEASFAGQQETYLNVIGKNQLFIAIKKCFASLYSARAIAYRKQTNFDTEHLSLAVVIQTMVESEVSGVLFTVNPVSKKNEQMMLNASWGLGEAIVSGKVTPDIYMYHKNRKRIIEKNLGEKEVTICYDTTGVNEKSTPLEQRIRFCLTEKQATQLFQLGQKIEQHYGTPQDIEWAISGGKLYLLQARPITTLSKKEPKELELTSSQRAVLNNWIEHCPTPLYPLDVTPCKLVDDAKGNVFHELGISTGSELTIDEQGVLSLSTGKIHISPRILKLPFLFRTFTDFTFNSTYTKDTFHKIKQELHDKNSIPSSQLSNEALITNLKELMKLSEEIAYVRFRYNIFPSVAVSKLISLDLKKVDKNINEFDLLSNLSYKTWDLDLSLKKLAAFIQNNSNLKRAFRNQDFSDRNTRTTFLNDYPDFRIKLNVFLDEFGWKSTSSYCAFSSVSWFEDMTNLFSLIKVLLHSKKNDTISTKYDKILSKITKRFHAKKASKLRGKIEEIRQYHVNREESLYLIEMCYGLARKTVFELSHRLPELFEEPNDILFLTLEEVYTLPNTIKNYKNKISIRKANRSQNEMLWNSLSLDPKRTNQTTLIGISGNHGMCHGKVKKILTLQEFDKMQSRDILLCRYTDPSWTPLFVLASAVVSDTGGPLSHSAIVAREYNIPAVLGLGNATNLLNDGDEIIVDGDSGKIVLMEKPKE